MKFEKIFIHKKPIIGMIHLPPLLGYKEHPGMEAVIKHALKDLKALELGGVDGVMVENEHDHPHQVTAGPEIISAMTIVVGKVVKRASVPVGLEILLNDPKASLAVAVMTGAQYIRTDYFVDKMSRKEYGGEMHIDPNGLMKYRKKIGAENVAIFTDIQVKYAKLLEKGKTISQSTIQAVNAGSDGIIVSGKNGLQPNIGDVKEAKTSSGHAPVIIGSGFSSENAKALLEWADVAIVGRILKNKKGFMDTGKVEKLMRLIKKFRVE